MQNARTTCKISKVCLDLGAETRSFLCHPYNLFSFLNSILLSSLVAPVQAPSINSYSCERSDMDDNVPQSTLEKNQVDIKVSASHIFSSDILYSSYTQGQWTRHPRESNSFCCSGRSYSTTDPFANRQYRQAPIARRTQYVLDSEIYHSS